MSQRDVWQMWPSGEFTSNVSGASVSAVENRLQPSVAAWHYLRPLDVSCGCLAPSAAVWCFLWLSAVTFYSPRSAYGCLIGPSLHICPRAEIVAEYTPTNLAE